MITPSPVSYDDWKQDGNFFSFGSHRVFYKEFGEGSPLLMIHGFPTCSWDWSWITDDLKDKFKLIIPDTMDSGSSKNPYRRKVTVMEQVDMLEALLEKLDLGAVHILAHDLGDTIAQEILARQQERRLSFRVMSAVYLNGGMLPDLHRPTDGQFRLAGPFGWWVARFMPTEKLLEGFASVFAEETRPDREMLNAFLPSILGQGGRTSLRRRIGYMAERQEFAYRWVGALKGTTVAQHMINGTADPVSGGHVADGIERRASTIKVTRLKGIGHYPQVEAPKEVVKAFLKWHRDQGTIDQ